MSDSHHRMKILVLVMKAIIGLLAFGFVLKYSISQT
jgi:hypothetical protein